MTMTIMEDLIAAGVRREDIDHHESDLYVKKTPISTKVIENYKFKKEVKTFRSGIDNKLWYELPFRYDPYWGNRGRKVLSKVKKVPIVAGVIERKDMVRKRVMGRITGDNSDRGIQEAYNRLCEEYNTDVFMVPDLYQGEYGYYELESMDESYYQPIADHSEMLSQGMKLVSKSKGTLVMSTAPGYMDRTDWEPVDSVRSLENWFDMYYELRDENGDD